jgi:hypothetical protein
MFASELREQCVRVEDDAAGFDRVVARMLAAGDVWLEAAGDDRWLRLREN